MDTRRMNGKRKEDFPFPVSDDAIEIAHTLEEPLVWLVQNVITVLGIDETEELLTETLRIDADGGMMTSAGDRQRTLGGVFFKLVKDRTSPKAQEAIFKSPPDSLKKAKEKANKDLLPPVPIVPLTWEEVLEEAAEAYKREPENFSVKLVIVGRPTQVSKARSCVVITMKGGPPPSLPKGLPPAPDGSQYTYAVFIANKQWAKVAPRMADNADHKLVVEGYPIFDPKRGVSVILAQNVRTVQKGKKGRAQQKFSRKNSLLPLLDNG